MIAPTHSLHRLRRAGAISLVACLWCAAGFGNTGLRLWVENDTEEADGATRSPVLINGKEVRLMWDTGFASHMVLYADSARRLGLAVTPPPAEINPRELRRPGHAVMRESKPAEITLFGNLEVRPVEVVDGPGGIFAEELGDGALGWLLMRQNPWVFLLGQHKFGPLETVPEAVTHFTTFDVLAADVLALASPTHPKTVYLIDTGSDSGFLLNPEAWRDWKARHASTPTTLGISFMVNDEWVPREEALAPEFDFTEITVRDVPVGEATLGHLDSELGKDRDLVVLGTAALQRLELIVDAPNKKAYARATTPEALDYGFNLFGAIFLPRGHALVAMVAKQSPAADAGLRDGDVLMKIDGVAMGNLEQVRVHRDLFNLRQPVGSTRTFTVTRGSEHHTFTVRARDFIHSPAGK